MNVLVKDKNVPKKQNLLCIFAEEFLSEFYLVFFKGFCKKNAHDTSCDDFADAHSQHEKRNASLCAVCIAQNKRYNRHICDNGWKRRGSEKCNSL